MKTDVSLPPAVQMQTKLRPGEVHTVPELHCLHSRHLTDTLIRGNLQQNNRFIELQDKMSLQAFRRTFELLHLWDTCIQHKN